MSASLPAVAVAPDALAEAVAHLQSGGLVAVPTETVWGLAADAGQPDAVARLLRWKGRDASQPVSVFVSGADALAALGVECDARVRRLAERFWPGPLTLVLPAPGLLAASVGRADGAVGFRCSSHPLCRALVEAAAAAGLGPLTATSLNLSGEPAARSRAEARALCSRAPGAPRLFDAPGPDAGGGAESTVLDLAASPPRVLREGALRRADLDPLLQETPLR